MEDFNKKNSALEEKREDFYVHKFYSYSGPNYYLGKPAMVFNLYVEANGPKVEFYKEKILAKFPALKDDFPGSVIDLFAKVLVEVNKMDLNLFTKAYSIIEDGDEWTIAFHCLDDYLAKDVVYLTADWFNAMNENDESFDFDKGFEELQQEFDKTLYGGPTIYSLVESGVKKKIAVHYLYEENQFMWGYGKKNVRGRSTIFHIDGIKDTEFTTYKDMCGEFLEMCGFPTPKGNACYSLEEAQEQASVLGFPVVIKPVDGHKGQGVTTGIESPEEVEKAFNAILALNDEHKVPPAGILVQQQIYGYDHRILTVGGKFAACLKRVPAYVVGDGKNTIKELIRIENDKEIRLDNARSPLAKIHIDSDLKDYLALQKKSLEDIPAEGEEIVLRRVANISAGGVSINVSNEIHPENIRMVENIAKFFKVTAMGIDVLAKDISKPWQEGNFGIIEINAGPGVFMHLAPAYGGSIDVPAKIMEHLFGSIEHFDRIPIICGNNISHKLVEMIYNKLKEYKPNIEFGSLEKDGIYLNNHFFTKNEHHDKNVAILLRNPKLDFAIINHTRDDIHDYGIWHQGCDMAILNHANYAEDYTMSRELLPGGLAVDINEKEKKGNDEISKLKHEIYELKKLIKREIDSEQLKLSTDGSDIYPKELIISQDKNDLTKVEIKEEDDADEIIFRAIEPYLKELLYKYDYYAKMENKPAHLDVDSKYAN
ncbi:MAG: cyanophycin synthetase [Bacteroidia bacterium]|nr:MAG: cyanophycin synthetase [Bacteroidia bacterium]